MLNFIYNPTAGKGKAQRFRASIEEKLNALGVAHRFWETNCRQDAKRIARELSEHGERDIIAMGGDGTINEVLNGLSDPGKVTLGLIPCGSGNDFAGAMGIPLTLEGALDIVLNEAPKPTDYLDCSGVRGLNIIGAGIDVEILQRCYRSKLLKGSLNYFVSLILELFQFDFHHFRSGFNGVERSHVGLIVCACNGKRFGGGFQICPKADVGDGKLDVVIVQDLKRRMIPQALMKLMQGKILEQKYTLHERTERLRAEFSKPTTIQIDGELYHNLPFDVRVVHNELRMYRK